MKDQIARKRLLKQAFAHLARAEALLLAARAKHELIAPVAVKKAA